jgi:uncharacterized cofD-like protein
MVHKDTKLIKNKKKKVVVIGGGTGTSVVLSGLKHYSVELSAIITTADDGSSSGVLRRRFEMIPPGDIRQCLIALAAGDYGYLNDRFQKGFLQGHTLGNLLITLFHQNNKTFQQAVDDLLRLVGAEGSIIPMTLHPVTLVAYLSNGKKLVGERIITSSVEINNNLETMKLLQRRVLVNPRAVAAIRRADTIIVGPGNLFSGIVPNFLVSEIKDAFRSSHSKKIYVANLFNQPGHTDSFTLSDFVSTISNYVGSDVFTNIIYNNKKTPSNILKKNSSVCVGKQLFASREEKNDSRFIGASLIGGIKKKDSSDPVLQTRNPFLHDSHKLARVLASLIG